MATITDHRDAPLLDRLRDPRYLGQEFMRLSAADEIDRLTAEVAKLRAALMVFVPNSASIASACRRLNSVASASHGIRMLLSDTRNGLPHSSFARAVFCRLGNSRRRFRARYRSRLRCHYKRRPQMAAAPPASRRRERGAC